MNPEAAAFPLLKITKVLLGLSFDLKDLVCKIVERFPCVGENHFFTEAV